MNSGFSRFPILLIKKYLTFRLHSLLLLDVFLFAANKIRLLLSWCIVIVGTYNPCTARKNVWSTAHGPLQCLWSPVRPL